MAGIPPGVTVLAHAHVAMPPEQHGIDRAQGVQGELAHEGALLALAHAAEAVPARGGYRRCRCTILRAP